MTRSKTSQPSLSWDILDTNVALESTSCAFNLNADEWVVLTRTHMNRNTSLNMHCSYVLFVSLSCSRNCGLFGRVVPKRAWGVSWCVHYIAFLIFGRQCITNMPKHIFSVIRPIKFSAGGNRHACVGLRVAGWLAVHETVGFGIVWIQRQIKIWLGPTVIRPTNPNWH